MILEGLLFCYNDLRYPLVQPTHRKFIKILRDGYNSGNPIILNENDIDDLLELFRIRTMPAVDRHQRLYKIFLRANYRLSENLSETGRFLIVSPNVIKTIEKRLFISEWRHPRMTIQSSFLVPLLQWMLKRMNNSDG